MSQRWALLLQYDGTDFAGSQWQPNQPTVQGSLQSALTALTNETITTSFAGRTDAGVHAAGQVASFLSDPSRPGSRPALSAHRWVRGLNHFLPDTIAVQDAAAVPIDWDPRRDAVARTYEYQLRLSNQRQPLWQRHAWIVPPPFNTDAAQSAISELLRTRDFAALTPPTTDRSTQRRLIEASLSRHGSAVTIRFRADAFLQHQVRRMVGAIVEVARGRMTTADFSAALQAATPGSMGPTAPAAGLCLVEVSYAQPIFNHNTHHCQMEPEGD